MFLPRLAAFICFSFVLCAQAEPQKVTLLFTNDFESAYDPTAAFWREDIERIGGVAQLSSLIQQIRAEEDIVFLFDAGDIFTGTLAKLTHGAISFELMLTMGYDAMAIGNHEFEYGWARFAEEKNRVPFPVLGANLFYRDTEHPYAQPYAIIERQGIRVGVIGILGQDAATALIPSNIAGLEVRDPVVTTAAYVELLRDSVDLVVVLTHQGMTAPMQTDDEADLTVQRGNAENLALAKAVPGIDVIFAGHTDAGTREPIVDPHNGTLIMQTYGQGQHLGYLQIELDGSSGLSGDSVRLGHTGKLITVDSDSLPADARIESKLDHFRAEHPGIYEEVGVSKDYLSRRYYRESDLGNLFADIVREATGADVGLMPSGALRKDLPQGVIRRVDLFDAFPFEDHMASVTVTGSQLRQIVEQGLSLNRGILQVSGMTICYAPEAEAFARSEKIYVHGEALMPDETYTLGTLEILAQGGDAYVQFADALHTEIHAETFADELARYFSDRPAVEMPASGRLNVAPCSHNVLTDPGSTTHAGR
ncbi:MAG: bifunctional metallophosphatase/5'-nucleotidase [Pseudomonadaceae bacterium]|nr:bifunctional metallophosphatase/5'-nucleotidase [Pseudomonadaceae bacterium]